MERAASHCRLGASMDCLAAGARHSLFLCQTGKQPLLDYSVKSTPAIKAGAQGPLLRTIRQHRRASNKSYGTSSFTSEPVPSSSRFLASRHGCNSSKFREDQVRSSSSQINRTNPKQNGRTSSANLTNRNPKNVDSITKNVNSTSTKLTSSSSNGHVAPIARPRRNNFIENGDASDAKLTNDRKEGNDGAHTSTSCADQITSEAFKPHKSNNQNGGASPSMPPAASEDEAFLSSGPVVETHSHVSGTSCADPEISEAFKPCKSNDHNGGASPSTPPSASEDKAFLSSGPLVEMHSHVSGNNEAPAFNNPDPSLSHLLASKNIIEFIIRFPGWADAQKERGMPQRQRRGFYSHEDWLRHRSSVRYVRHVLSSVSSRVIVSLVPPVFTFTAGAIGVAAYNTAVKLSVFPSFFPILHAASLPYELTAPALALLLVFRTDASYSRYDEARKTWTSVISTTKDLARQSAQLIKNSQDVALKSSLLNYIMAFPISLKCHLIHGSDIRKDLQGLLQDDDLAFVLASRHRPNCLIQLMSQSLGLVRLENTERILLENHITQYTASVSVCERLIRTPIPLSYTRLTSRFLVLWHMSLPIVLWDSCNWLVVPATFFSAATLFCIEEVGVLIEEPFPMLALDKIIGVAHDNIREMMKRQQDTDYFLSQKRSHQTSSAEK